MHPAGDCVNASYSGEGRGYTEFGRTLFGLNIDICLPHRARKGPGRADEWHVAGRLVKELRLRGISSMEAAKAHPLSRHATLPIPRWDVPTYKPMSAALTCLKQRRKSFRRLESL